MKAALYGGLFVFTIYTLLAAFKWPPGKSGFQVARCIAVHSNNFLYNIKSNRYQIWHCWCKTTRWFFWGVLSCFRRTATYSWKKRKNTICLLKICKIIEMLRSVGQCPGWSWTDQRNWRELVPASSSPPLYPLVGVSTKFTMHWRLHKFKTGILLKADKTFAQDIFLFCNRTNRCHSIKRWNGKS